jgi:hypothetical protein
MTYIYYLYEIYYIIARVLMRVLYLDMLQKIQIFCFTKYNEKHYFKIC